MTFPGLNNNLGIMPNVQLVGATGNGGGTTSTGGVEGGSSSTGLEFDFKALKKLLADQGKEALMAKLNEMQEQGLITELKQGSLAVTFKHEGKKYTISFLTKKFDNGQGKLNDSVRVANSDLVATQQLNGGVGTATLDGGVVGGTYTTTRTDENGNKITETYCGNLLIKAKIELKDGSIIWETEYKYDENGKAVSETTTTYRNGKLESKSETTLDENGPVHRTTYNYDENGNVKTRQESDFNKFHGPIATNTYDKDGVLLSTMEYGYDENGEIISNTLLKYDKDGNLVEQLEFDDGDLVEKFQYTYDKDGNIVFLVQELYDSRKYTGKIEVSFDKSKRPEVIKRYDAQGNLNSEERRQYDEEGNRVSTEYIEYENGKVKSYTKIDANNNVVVREEYYYDDTAVVADVDKLFYRLRQGDMSALDDLRNLGAEIKEVDGGFEVRYDGEMIFVTQENHTETYYQNVQAFRNITTQFDMGLISFEEACKRLEALGAELTPNPDGSVSYRLKVDNRMIAGGISNNRHNEEVSGSDYEILRDLGLSDSQIDQYFFRSRTEYNNEDGSHGVTYSYILREGLEIDGKSIRTIQELIRALQA